MPIIRKLLEYLVLFDVNVIKISLSSIIRLSMNFT